MSADTETHFDGKVAQKANIDNAGEVLVIRDPREGVAALWELPGGRLTVNESCAEGLIREIKEELGATNYCWYGSLCNSIFST